MFKRSHEFNLKRHLDEDVSKEGELISDGHKTISPTISPVGRSTTEQLSLYITYAKHFSKLSRHEVSSFCPLIFFAWYSG